VPTLFSPVEGWSVTGPPDRGAGGAAAGRAGQRAEGGGEAEEV